MDSRALLFLALVHFASSALPNGWKACSRTSAGYHDCMIKEITNAVHTVMDGDKKLGSPRMDPLRLHKLVIPKHNSPVAVDMTLTDVDVIGIKDFKFLEFKSDWKNNVGVIVVPDIIAVGKYKMNGNVLTLPITGDGKFNITFHDVTVNFDVEYKRTEKDGKIYFQMEKFHTNLSPKRLYIKLDNLFNGNKALGDNMNLFLNENWDKILEEIRPAMNVGISDALTQISNGILSQIPADEIDIP